MRIRFLTRRTFGATVLLVLTTGIAFGVAGSQPQQAKLVAADAANGDDLGLSVAFAGDTVVAGESANNSNSGAVYVFTRSGTTWTQQAKLSAADEVKADIFGSSVAIAADT